MIGVGAMDGSSNEGSAEVSTVDIINLGVEVIINSSY